MTRSARWLTLSVLIMLLLSPLAGVSPFSSVQQELLSGAPGDGGRGPGDDYSVELNTGDRQEDDEVLTRNQTRSYEFIVTNSGSQDDTYNLTVDWDDPEGYGWHGSLAIGSISVPADQDRTFDLVVTSPRGGVVRDNSTMFNLNATSTNSTTISDDEFQLVRIITPYAVDVYDIHPASQSAKRGEMATFDGVIKNVGDNTDSYELRVDFVPKDWVAELLTTGCQGVRCSIDSVESGETGQYQLEVTVPDTAEQDEYALVRITVTSETNGYSHIDGESWANTTTSDGRTYGIYLWSDSGSRQAIPGGPAEYVLTVSNSGSENDTVLLEVDSSGMPQGWNAALDRYRIEDLGPSVQTTVRLEVYAPQDATADDWGVAGVEARSENREQHRDQASVNTTVRIPVRDVDLAFDSETKAGESGEQLTYTLTLTNSGSDPDSYDLTVQKPATWQIQLNASQVEDLPEGESATLELQVTIPSNSRDTDTALATVTATSRGDSSVSNATEALTTVATVFVLAMTVDRSAQSLNPGNSTSFTYTLYNYGNGHENITFIASGLPSAWTVTWLPDRVELAPFSGTAEVTVTIAVPSDQTPYTADLNLVASVEDNPDEQAERSVTLTVEYYAALQLQLEQTTASGLPGSSHTFDFTLTNQGNLQDIITLSTAGLPDSWQVRFADPDHPQVGLVLVTLDPGAPMELELTTTSGSQEIASTFQFMLVATSGNNPQVSAEEPMAVVVEASHGLELEASETTKQSLPGQPVFFSFIVRNNGNAPAGVQLVALGVPADWNGSFSVQSPISLDPLEATSPIFLNLQLPNDTWGGIHLLLVTATSTTTGEQHTLNFTLEIPLYGELSLQMLQKNANLFAGEQGSYQVRITNDRNTREELVLSIEGKYAHWYQLPSSSVVLEPGEMRELTITVSPPANSPSLNVRDSRLNVTLSSDLSSSSKLDLPLSVTEVQRGGTDSGGNDESSIPAPSALAVFAALGAGLRLHRRR